MYLGHTVEVFVDDSDAIINYRLFFFVFLQKYFTKYCTEIMIVYLCSSPVPFHREGLA